MANTIIMGIFGLIPLGATVYLFVLLALAKLFGVPAEELLNNVK